MSALTQDRNTPLAQGPLREGAVAAAQLIFAGSIVCRNATGFLVKGSTAVGLIGVGRAEHRADNSAGAAGDIQLRYVPGSFRFANSAGGDEISIADIGKACFVVDDQTVAKTSATNTRSKAGVVDFLDDQGVWVRMDEALTRVTA
jgi:hypothetical protein